jgi:hypothetical protein
MEFTDWRKQHEARPGQRTRPINYLDAEVGWAAAKADCQQDITGWTASAYDDGGLAMEARCLEKITKFRDALLEIYPMTTPANPAIARYRMKTIRAIIERTVD